MTYVTVPDIVFYILVGKKYNIHYYIYYEASFMLRLVNCIYEP